MGAVVPVVTALMLCSGPERGWPTAALGIPPHLIPSNPPRAGGGLGQGPGHMWPQGRGIPTFICWQGTLASTNSLQTGVLVPRHRCISLCEPWVWGSAWCFPVWHFTEKRALR